MHENITAYLDQFSENATSGEALQKQVELFANDFTQSGLMHPNGMEAMGERVWASKEALREEAAAMTAEEVCVCFSAFLQQEAFIPGILLDLVQQGVIPALLRRLKELDA